MFNKYMYKCTCSDKEKETCQWVCDEIGCGSEGNGGEGAGGLEGGGRGGGAMGWGIERLQREGRKESKRERERERERLPQWETG